MEEKPYGRGFRPPPPPPVQIGLTLSGPAFSVICQTRGVLKGPDDQNQDLHQPIEMKLCMSYYD